MYKATIRHVISTAHIQYVAQLCFPLATSQLSEVMTHYEHIKPKKRSTLMGCSSNNIGLCLMPIYGLLSRKGEALEVNDLEILVLLSEPL